MDTVVLEVRHDLQDGVPGPLSVLLVPSDGDEILILIPFVWKLDGDIVVLPDLGNDRSLLPYDFWMVFGIHADRQLKASQCLKSRRERRSATTVRLEEPLLKHLGVTPWPGKAGDLQMGTAQRSVVYTHRPPALSMPLSRHHSKYF